MRIPTGLRDRLMEANGRLYTLSVDPGHRVYGEKLIMRGGGEWREWSVTRSNPAAYLAVGGSAFPIKRDSRLLYLGAASGTTASHFSDIVDQGTVHCLEFSARSFRDLVRICGRRGNMIPLMGDATRPESFAFAVGDVDIVYQDVAQKGQATILADNMDAFNAGRGMLAVKARSEDVTASPHDVFVEAHRTLVSRGLRVVECRTLDPHEKDHAMIVVER